MIYGTKKEGFTLVELIVVMAVIGILSTVVFMSFGAARENARIKKETGTVEMFKLNMRLYREQTGEYPPGSDVCTFCASSGTWTEVADALTPTFTPAAIYKDAWGNAYEYDNNYGSAYNPAGYYTLLCSRGPNGTYDTDLPLLTDTRPTAGGDDICVFFR